MPWALTVSYGISMREDQSRQINPKRMRYPYSFTQSLNFSGYLRIAEGGTSPSLRVTTSTIMNSR